MSNNLLGKNVDYNNVCDNYNPSVLYSVPRKIQRDNIGENIENLFVGFDIWNAYEIFWLGKNNIPRIGIASITYGADSKCIVESKSMKLYLNSFNSTQFENESLVRKTIEEDISKAISGNVNVSIVTHLDDFENQELPRSSEILKDYKNIDDIDVMHLDEKHINKSHFDKRLDYLEHLREKKSEHLDNFSNLDNHEKLYTNLFKSNCPITNQPDFASIFIEYKGQLINHEALLRYLISFRDHNEFHESCVERIFYDILSYVKLKELTVYGRYTRRGGIEINVFRTNSTKYSQTYNLSNIYEKVNFKLARQ